MSLASQNWQLISLKEVCDLQNGYAFKSSEYVEHSNTLNCRMSNIRPNGVFDLDHNPKYLPDVYCDKYKNYILKDGDVIIAMTDMATKAKILGVPTVVSTKGKNLLLNQRVGKLVIRNPELLYFPYLQYALNRDIVKKYYLKFAGGGLQINLGKEDLLSVQIPLPPLEEQKRIAEILDKADAIRSKRKEAIRLTEELLRSTFLDMFGDPGKNPKGWKKAFVEDIAEKVTDGTHHTPERTNTGIKLLSARNVKNGYIDLSEGVDFIPQHEFERLKKRYDPQSKDVLISCSGSVGRVTVVRNFEPFSMVRSVAVVRPKTNSIDSEFLESLLQSPYLQASILRGSKKSSQANLFQGAIKDLPVIVPPLSIQNDWCEYKTKLLKVKKQYLSTLKTNNILFNSLLQKAFRGEL